MRTLVELTIILSIVAFITLPIGDIFKSMKSVKIGAGGKKYGTKVKSKIGYILIVFLIIYFAYIGYQEMLLSNL